MSKFIVTTAQTVIRKYYVEVEDHTWAHDGICMGELDEFCSIALGEDIVDTMQTQYFPPQKRKFVNGATNVFNYEKDQWDKEVHWELAE